MVTITPQGQHRELCLDMETNEPDTDLREKVRDVKEGLYFTDAWQGVGLVILILIVVGLVAGGLAGRSIAAMAGALVGLAFFGVAIFSLGGMLAVFVRTLVREPQPVRNAREGLRDPHPEGRLDRP